LATFARLAGDGGGLLIGIDLDKDPEILYRAYNDSRGANAAFILNVLTRINHELGGNFDEERFTYSKLLFDYVCMACCDKIGATALRVCLLGQANLSCYLLLSLPILHQSLRVSVRYIQFMCDLSGSRSNACMEYLLYSNYYYLYK
jgi:hypothetical protein